MYMATKVNLIVGFGNSATMFSRAVVVSRSIVSADKCGVVSLQISTDD